MTEGVAEQGGEEVVVQKELLRRGGTASWELSIRGFDAQYLDMGRNDYAKHLVGVSVFFPKEWFSADKNPTWEEIVAKVKMEGEEILIYGGGINWRGGKLPVHKSEVVGLRRLSPESKREETEVSAMNYLVNAGKRVVITLDPELEFSGGQGVVSSLRAEWLAEKAVMEQLREADLKYGRLEWSRRAYSDLQTNLAGFCAISQDLRYGLDRDLFTETQLERASENQIGYYMTLVDNLRRGGNKKKSKKYNLEVPVFKSGREAWEYFWMLNNVTTMRGGGLAIPEELAHPIDSTDPNWLKRDIVRPLANWLVKTVGMAEGNPLIQALVYGVLPRDTPGQAGDVLVVSRLMGLGRGKKDIFGANLAGIECWVARKLIQSALGVGLDIVLADTSGDVVNAASSWAGAGVVSRLIFGSRSMFVETHDMKVGEKSKHAEIKQPDVINHLETLAWMYKRGLFSGDVEREVGKRRYVVANLKAALLHPNGSTIHYPLKLNLEVWERLQALDLEDKDRQMLNRAKAWVGEDLAD